MKPYALVLSVCLASLCGSAAAAAEPYTLDQLLSLALQGNKGVEAAAAGVDAARAGITTAGAYPNPEVEFTTGRVSARQPGAAAGTGQTLAVTQRIDLPSQRSLRHELATGTLRITTAGQDAYIANLVAQVKRGFFETLRREAEFAAAQEDLALTQQLYDRAQVRVDVGDAPKYEAIRVGAELLNAQKNSQSALLRVNQAKSFLRQQVGDILPPSFAVRGRMGLTGTLEPLEMLRGVMLESNPELTQYRAELRRAQSAVDYERSLRLPTVALKATSSRDPDVRDTQIGVVVSVPIWDRRQGPVAEAQATVIRMRSLMQAREFELTQQLDSAYQEFQIAASQADALESGIVRQAEAALRVAEAAYRYGERGIIDYLDAQRVLRTARNDLIAAQFDLQTAAIEIERLLANSSAGAPL
ncbi:Cobalt-zinc-cadmium resistance protein CzcC precursor [Pigmentiphaga humi]|uniref:Cobalt-zinc-cadmium resistance protein CzcC n=1 Tax=Pigmentiphaga humi TaxID=2478468 RepID=A0A3P4B3W2_9BURK|nr:TolC family protein [Pigmentiphaga humi]VCU70206.1 Cobalt-zinc-cadmium resistance protein CzcC precursor [Pigmentiphaga humi]